MKRRKEWRRGIRKDYEFYPRLKEKEEERSISQIPHCIASRICSYFIHSFIAFSFTFPFSTPSPSPLHHTSYSYFLLKKRKGRGRYSFVYPLSTLFYTLFSPLSSVQGQILNSSLLRALERRIVNKQTNRQEPHILTYLSASMLTHLPLQFPAYSIPQVRYLSIHLIHIHLPYSSLSGAAFLVFFDALLDLNNILFISTPFVFVFFFFYFFLPSQVA